MRLRRLDWMRLAGVLVAAGLVVALVRLWLRTQGFIDTDTYQVLDGTARITTCLSQGLHPCGPGVNEFALLQYLPALAMKELGYSFDQAARDLIRLNGLCFFALLGLAVPLGRALASRTAAVAYAIAVLTSPALWYAHAGHGELIGALAVTSVAVAVLRSWAWPLVASATFMAAISKETALPFVLIVAFAAVRSRQLRGGDGPSRRELAAVAAGAALGAIANVGFNLFRYGTVGNEDYLRAELHVPTVQVLKNAAALVVAPTGGLIWFWPVALMIIAAAGLSALRTVRSLREAAREPVVLMIAAFLGVLVLFSLWYSPYGGAAWGPRLLLPWMPAFVVVALAGAPAVVRGLERLLTGNRVVAVWLAVALAGLPQLGAMIDTSRFSHTYPGERANRAEVAVQPFFADRVCPRYPAIEEGRQYYFGCLNHQTWGRGLAVARGLRAAGDGSPILVLTYVLTLGVLLELARRTDATDRQPVSS